MKIRITDPGFAGFNGHLGTAFFVDGVCDDVSPQEAERMASILSFEEVDTGLNPSVTQRMVDLVNKNADEMGINSDAVLVKAMQPLPTPAPLESRPEQIPQLPTLTGLTYDYTQEQLSALADAEGIAGIRAFAAVYGINGRSLNGIIKELLDLKGLHNKPAQEQALAAQTDADIVSTEVLTHTDDKGNVTTEVVDKVELRAAPTEAPVRDIAAPAAAPVVTEDDEDDLELDLDTEEKAESPEAVSETTANAAAADTDKE
uniref:Uncharacterized protein n=1 Tax=Pseudomonas phage Nican01 TaxID=3138540 RepID=A0AAU6W0M9_9CAUD